MTKKTLPELLAPAGSMDALRAAVAGGADAVYFGGGAFNARLRAQNFTDDDSGQTDDNGTATHIYRHTAQILGIQCAAEADQAIGQNQTHQLHGVGVDALRAAHITVGAGCADGTAQFSSKKPVECGNDCNDKHQRNQTGTLLFPYTDQQRKLVHTDGQHGFAHNTQVDGIECQLGQNAG